MLEDRLPPLDREEITRAKRMIDRQQPLSHIPLIQIIPFAEAIYDTTTWCLEAVHLKKRDESEEDEKHNEDEPENKGLKNLLQRAKTAHIGIDEEPYTSENVLDLDQNKNFRSNPFLYLGFGLWSYLEMMRVLTIAFALFTLILIPVFYVYRSGTNYSAGYVATHSLGNLGYSTESCMTANLTDSFLLTCDQGYVSKLVSVGMIPDVEGANLKTCMPEGENSFCKAGDYFKKTEFIKDFETVFPNTTKGTPYFVGSVSGG